MRFNVRTTNKAATRREDKEENEITNGLNIEVYCVCVCVYLN